SYEVIFQKLRDVVENVPKTFLFDFEKASWLACESTFGALVDVGACLFHLAQSVYRKVVSCGLQTAYRDDESICLNVKMLVALAFVPEDDLIESFNLLAEQCPPALLDVLDYFERTYIGAVIGGQRQHPLFAPKNWNQWERVNEDLPRTNNALEEWHNAFQNAIGCSHPSP